MPLSDEDALALTIDIYFRLLRHAVEDDTLTRLMDDIAQSIRHSERVCDDVARSAQHSGRICDEADRLSDYAAICDEECAYIEDLIGASFIVLQTKIRRVSSRAVSLDQELRRFGVVIPGFDVQPAVLALGDIYKGTGSTLVQLIWDLGNYFKHRDEWPSEVWDDDAQTIDKRWKDAWRTRKSVARAGIERSSTGNMRTAFEFFGIEPYSRCALLAEKVQEWANHVHYYAQAKLPVEPEILHRARARRYPLSRRAKLSE